jgi:hypothetical protein
MGSCPQVSKITQKSPKNGQKACISALFSIIFSVGKHSNVHYLEAGFYAHFFDVSFDSMMR